MSTFYSNLRLCILQITNIPLAPLFLTILGHHFCTRTSTAAEESRSTQREGDEVVEAEDEEEGESAHQAGDLPGRATHTPLENERCRSETETEGTEPDDTDLQGAEEETFLDARDDLGE